jgi:8-oxo-dGTP diphosphatase
METATLVFPVFAGCVTLARKKRGVGAGLYNGYGGKLVRGEGGDPRVGAKREFIQETGATCDVLHLDERAIIRFYEAGKSIFDCHAFLLHEWQGEIKESEEMGPPQVFPYDSLPYMEMMRGDREWLPRILLGDRLRCKVYYNTGNKSLIKFEYGPLY